MLGLVVSESARRLKRLETSLHRHVFLYNWGKGCVRWWEIGRGIRIGFGGCWGKRRWGGGVRMGRMASIYASILLVGWST